MSADASIDPWGADVLGWLLNPITPDDFLRDIWERQRHLLSRARPDHYGRFFTRDDLEMVITSTGVPSRSEMLIARHDRPRQLIPKTREGLGDLGAVLRAYADGYTFVTAHLEELSPVIGRLCRALEARLQLHVIANVYLTPADTQSFGLHWDNHDVFILQLEGAKRWRMWGPTYEKPLRDSPVRLTREQLGEPDIVEVQAGDLFYVPRGHPHEPFTAGVSSLHVTLGLFPETWYSLMQTAVRVTTERDVRFRGALPVGYLNSASVRAEMAAKFRELAALFASDANFDASVTRLSTNAISALAPPAGGHFTSLDRLSSIALDTIVTKPSSSLCTIVVDGPAASICFPGGVVTGSSALVPVFQFIADAAGPFKVSALPDILTDRHKIELATRFVKEGLLVIPGAGAGAGAGGGAGAGVA